MHDAVPSNADLIHYSKCTQSGASPRQHLFIAISIRLNMVSRDHLPFRKNTEGYASSPRLDLKISFFQDFFTIIEELVKRGPNIGLPSGFNVKKELLDEFEHLQDPEELKMLYLKKNASLGSHKSFPSLKKVQHEYIRFWILKLPYLLKEYFKLRRFNYSAHLTAISAITKTSWEQSCIPVFLTIGYKDSGVYDRDINVVRIGTHQKKEQFTKYTLIHELIHLHIVENMNLKLDPAKEETLCRAIFAETFPNDRIAVDHWKMYLKPKELQLIESARKKLQEGYYQM